MLYEHESLEGASQASRRAFAASLSDTLGHDGALQICRDSGWDGIFDILFDESVPNGPWHGLGLFATTVRRMPE